MQPIYMLNFCYSTDLRFNPKIISFKQSIIIKDNQVI
jgi:hypothetical protein